MLEYVKTADAQYLRVDVVGTGPTVVVLVHGIGGSSHMWTPFTLQLRNEYTFIIPNLRGFGKSSMITFANKNDVLTDFADDLNAVINQYKQESKVIICSLSLGAYATMRYFEKYGSDDVDRYLNIDQAPKAINHDSWNHGLFGERQEMLLDQFNSVLAHFKPNLAKPFAAINLDLKRNYLASCGQFFDMAFSRPIEQFIVTNIFAVPLLGKVATKIVSADMWESYYYCITSVQDCDYDFRKVMINLDIPITLFVGKYSKMYPKEGQLYIAEHGKQVDVVMFDEGHGLMYTAPLIFAKRFTEFLSSSNISIEF